MAKRKPLHGLPAGITVKKTAERDLNIFVSDSSLDWYKLTESTRHILNTLMASSAKKQIAERLKTHPDHARLQALKTLSLTAAELSRDASNFESKERMEEIIAAYADIEVV